MTTSPNYDDRAAIEWNLDKLYPVLSRAKDNIYPHSNSGLTPTEKLHLLGLLCGYSPAEIAKQLVINPQGLNVALSKTIYRYVEDLTGHDLNSIDNWRQVVEWLDTAGYRATAAIDWGEAPDITTFYGRETELKQLKHWILNDRCRLVALLGMGGIGKTALATVLVEQIKDQFEWVVWRSLRTCPPIEKFLPGLLPKPSAAENPSVDLSTVMQYLRDRRCLIILDEVEGLLTDYPVGHYREGYEAYGEILRRISTERHQSCALIASREKPKGILFREEKKSLTRSLLLDGLKEAANQILQDKELQDDNHQWQTVIQLYGGNPLALKIVAGTIQDLFGGSVNQFLRENTTFIDSELCEILDQQFTRLSKSETEVLRQLATQTQPVSISVLRETVANSNSCIDSIQVIESLRRRSLLEKIKNKDEPLFTLHPIVLKYAKRMYIDKNETI
jgi:NB-ARC domain